MSRILSLELTAAALPLDRLTREVRDHVTAAGQLASVNEPGDPVDAVLTLGSGLWVSVSEPVVSQGPDQFAVDFGLARAATVDLQVNATLPAGPQVEEALSVVFGLLARVPGDAVLHEDYARVWLLRRGDQLVLSDDDDVWRPDRLARVPQPHRRDRLRFSDASG